MSTRSRSALVAALERVRGVIAQGLLGLNGTPSSGIVQRGPRDRGWVRLSWDPGSRQHAKAVNFATVYGSGATWGNHVSYLPDGTAKNWQWCEGCGNLWECYFQSSRFQCRCAEGYQVPFPESLWEAIDAAATIDGPEAVHAFERQLYAEYKEREAARIKGIALALAKEIGQHLSQPPLFIPTPKLRKRKPGASTQKAGSEKSPAPAGWSVVQKSLPSSTGATKRRPDRRGRPRSR